MIHAGNEGVGCGAEKMRDGNGGLINGREEGRFGKADSARKSVRASGK